jgi:hypothetical protein
MACGGGGRPAAGRRPAGSAIRPRVPLMGGGAPARRLARPRRLRRVARGPARDTSQGGSGPARPGRAGPGRSRPGWVVPGCAGLGRRPGPARDGPGRAGPGRTRVRPGRAGPGRAVLRPAQGGTLRVGRGMLGAEFAPGRPPAGSVRAGVAAGPVVRRRSALDLTRGGARGGRGGPGAPPRAAVRSAAARCRAPPRAVPGVARLGLGSS